MALFIYNSLLVLFAPLITLFIQYRRTRGKESAAAMPERWGNLPEAIQRDPRRPRFWVHAVSIGEVMAAVPVLRQLRSRWPDALIVLSTTTVGGREVAQKQTPPADFVIAYPLDFSFVVNRALNAVRPDAVLLMEWEIWPNFLTAAKRRGAKIAVLNGRISDKGLRRGQRSQFFTRPALDAADRFLMQSDEDARRAALVGVAPEKIKNLGNTKFDESAVLLSAGERATLRADLGIPPDAPVWICGSTRDGEEEIIAEAFAKARERLPDLQLIVAPRHLDRADEAAKPFIAAGYGVRRRSRPLPLTPSEERGGTREGNGTDNTVGTHAVRPPFSKTSPRLVAGQDALRASLQGAASSAPIQYPPVPPLPSEGEGVRGWGLLLLDTFGELARVYAVAGVAFVGGSLKPFGGQSVFQPLSQGVPAVFGPYMNNQRDIAALAKAEGVGFSVTDAETLAAEVVRILTLPEAEKIALATRARQLIERNKGVAARCVDEVARLLNEAGEAK